jgi:hypothetical protein
MRICIEFSGENKLDDINPEIVLYVHVHRGESDRVALCIVQFRSKRKIDEISPSEV